MLDIHKRYHDAVADFHTFLAEPKHHREVGAYFREMAEIQLRMMQIQAEATGLLLERLKEVWMMPAIDQQERSE